MNDAFCRHNLVRDRSSAENLFPVVLVYGCLLVIEEPKSYPNRRTCPHDARTSCRSWKPNKTICEGKEKEINGPTSGYDPLRMCWTTTTVGKFSSRTMRWSSSICVHCNAKIFCVGRPGYDSAHRIKPLRAGGNTRKSRKIWRKNREHPPSIP